MTIEAEPNPLRRRSLALCLVAGFMTLLHDSIVNVALTSIRTGLGARESAIQWIIAGYALAFGMFGATIGISTAIGPLLGGFIVKVGGLVISPNVTLTLAEVDVRYAGSGRRDAPDGAAGRRSASRWCSRSSSANSPARTGTSPRR